MKYLSVILPTALLLILSIDTSAQRIQQMGQDILGEDDHDAFGYAVSLSHDGTTALIGGRWNNSNGLNSGHARVCDWNGNAWVQRGGDIDGKNIRDEFGRSVALSANGNTAVIGAPYNPRDDISAYQQWISPGYAAVYDWDAIANQWKQRGQNILGESKRDRFGWSVAISADGNTILIGGITNDGNKLNSGHVRVYDWDGNAWVQRGLDIDGKDTNDFLGSSVSMSEDGNTILIGALCGYWKSNRPGYAYVYAWNGNAWVQRGQDLEGESNNDYFGWSCDMSANGSTIVVGAPSNRANGTNSGHARVYDWNGNAWVQRGRDIDGKVHGETMGRTVAISNDGNMVLLIGAGSVGRLYVWNGQAWVQQGADIDGGGGACDLSADGSVLMIGSPGHKTVKSGFARAYRR